MPERNRFRDSEPLRMSWRRSLCVVVALSGLMGSYQVYDKPSWRAAVAQVLTDDGADMVAAPWRLLEDQLAPAHAAVRTWYLDAVRPSAE